MISLKDVVAKLEARDFEALIGLIERDWLDAKDWPYHFDPDKAKREITKRELAKDVTAMANANGGIIVTASGCQPRQVSASAKCVPFPSIESIRIDAKRFWQSLFIRLHMGCESSSMRIRRSDSQGVAPIIIDPAFVAEGPA
jgi:hypothetical protein